MTLTFFLSYFSRLPPKRYFETKGFLYELENKLRTKECNGRGNHVPFMTKELSKSIMTRSRIKNKYNKWLSRETFQALKQIMNKCTNLTKTAKEQ